MDGMTVNIKGLDYAEVLAALFNASKQQGMGFLHAEGRQQMTKEDAQEILKQQDSFDYLRARRNAAVQDMHQKMADEWGVPLQSLRSNFNPAKCYCACGTGGPCEHKWDGPDWESEDGCACSVTCSLCGCTAMSHDMRNAP